MTEENKKEVEEQANKLMELVADDPLLLEVAKEIIFEGRCRECLRLLHGEQMCWGCYSSPDYGE